MTEERMNLEARLQRIEKQNRSLKRWASSLCLGLVAVGLMSATLPNLCKTIWAERFILRDSENRDRMIIDAYSHANPTFQIMDKKGKIVSELAFDLDGSLAAIQYDAKGKTLSRTKLVGAPSDGPTERDVLY
jgi:hypothetical protein